MSPQSNTVTNSGLSRSSGNSPKVSIVIPVYNGANYLENAIDSALAQTYENIEIIVVNDGSNDEGETKKICENYKSKIHYIEQNNTGVAGAINKALEFASGHYFCWLSHDDEFLPQKTEKQVQFLSQFHSSNLIAFSNYYLMNEEGEIWHQSNLDIDLLRKTPGLALLRGMVNGCTIMVPMEILRKHLPFDETLKYTQDYEMWDRLREDAEFILMPDTLIKYRIHSRQATDSRNLHVIEENDRLWKNMISNRSNTEKVILNGSTKKFYSEMVKFLQTTPYSSALKFAEEKSKIPIEGIQVSVIIPFFNDLENLRRAIESVMRQSHKNWELFLINDGSTDQLEPLLDFIEHEGRIRLVNIENSGPGYARNVGLELASGEYIAFLDSDDEFAHDKISLQLNHMIQNGGIFSHTSYLVKFEGGRKGKGRINSGDYSGKVYPQIIGSCPIATPTVMIHRIVIPMGFVFPTNKVLNEDVQAWIWLAQRAELLGINAPLTTVYWRNDSAALDLRKNIEGIGNLRESLKEDKAHSSQVIELSKLEKMQKDMEHKRDFLISSTDAPDASNILNLDTIRLAYPNANSNIDSPQTDKYVLEIGNERHPSSKRPFAVIKRSI